MSKHVNSLSRGYELTFITRSEMSDASLLSLKEKISSIVTSFQGEVVLTEDWGKRKFAYPIQKQLRGHYTYLVFSAPGVAVTELERNLKLSEDVVRFLTIQLDAPFVSSEFKQSRQTYHAAVKRREEEREARRESREDGRRSYGGYERSTEKPDHFDVVEN
jgi:small subunit ribosomal protein S6